MKEKIDNSEREGKRVRVTYYMPTLGVSPVDSSKLSIEYSYIDSLIAVGEREHYIGGTKWVVFKVEPID